MKSVKFRNPEPGKRKMFFQGIWNSEFGMGKTTEYGIRNPEFRTTLVLFYRELYRKMTSETAEHLVLRFSLTRFSKIRGIRVSNRED
uniref:Terminase n=2 Tax=Caenorhabditis tropicalis TaxID=1561998 RepID=A0A1I7UDH8_9PELO